MMKKLLSLAAISLLAACAAPIQEVHDAEKSVNDQLQSAQQWMAATTVRDDAVVHRVSGAWLGGKPIPVSSEVTLPEIFRTPYEFRDLTGKKINLASFARIFTLSTGLPIRVGDVYSTQRSGTPGATPAGAGMVQGAPPVPIANGAPIPIATGMPLASAAGFQTTNPSDPVLSSIDLVYTRATPEQVLNDAASQWNINWQWQDGAVVFTKYITRKFPVRMPATDVASKTELGKSSDSKSNGGGGSGSGGGSTIQTGFTSSSKITAEADIKAFDTLVAELKEHLTDTKVTPNKVDGTITVTGNRDNVLTAQKLIDRSNEIVSRSAKFNIAIFQVKKTKKDNFGSNLNVLFTNLSQKFGFNLTAPASLVSADAGGINFNILTPSGSTPSRFDGSAAVFNALHQFGDVVTLRQLDVVARNRRPTPVNLTNQTSYLAQTTPATATSGGTGGVPGLTPGVVTTGFAANLQANINDSNQINLSLNLGIVDLVSIDKFGTGSGASAQMIQLPVTTGFEFQQDVDLRPGEVMILTGYETKVDQYMANKLAREAPIFLNGSFNGSGTQDKIVIVVTPTSISNSL